MTRDELREVVKRQWGDLQDFTWTRDQLIVWEDTGANDDSGRYLEAAGYPNNESAAEAVAAAVCAPDLWELVEAVEEWRRARMEWSELDPPEEAGAELIERETELCAALARVKAEEGSTP